MGPVMAFAKDLNEKPVYRSSELESDDPQGTLPRLSNCKTTNRIAFEANMQYFLASTIRWIFKYRWRHRFQFVVVFSDIVLVFKTVSNWNVRFDSIKFIANERPNWYRISASVSLLEPSFDGYAGNWLWRGTHRRVLLSISLREWCHWLKMDSEFFELEWLLINEDSTRMVEAKNRGQKSRRDKHCGKRLLEPEPPRLAKHPFGIKQQLHCFSQLNFAFFSLSISLSLSRSISLFSFHYASFAFYQFILMRLFAIPCWSVLMSCYQCAG